MNMKQVAQALQDAEDNDDRLTPWERNFIASINSQLESDDTFVLTENQLNKLQQISDKVNS